MNNYDGLIEAVLSGNAVLFLGAGASASSTLKDGQPVPLGNSLASIIYKEFFPEETYENESLQYTSTLVCSNEIGRKKLHSFLYDLFDGINPSQGLVDLSKFYWRNIYTTNIDQALENAYKKSEDKAQDIIPVVGPRDIGSENIHIKVTLNKLHGCITRKDVSLVFSLEDYANYRDGHLKLFEKLNSDLVDRFVIFIGYSLQDSNFQQEWATIKKYCQPTTIKNRYFFVSPKIKSSLETFLSSEGFTCCQMDIDEFGAFLVNRTKGRRESLNDYYFKNIAPVELLQTAALCDEERYIISTDYDFPLIEIKKPTIKNIGFYKGFEPKWGDLKYNLDITRDLLEDLLEDFNRWFEKPKRDFWIITGRAGDGKSTLLKRLAIEIASKVGEIVLFAGSRSSLNPVNIVKFQEAINQPIVLLIDNISDRETKVNKLIEFIKDKNAKVLIIGASRISDWNVATDFFITGFKEYKLDKLSDNEIELFIEKLTDNDSLGHLENFDELGKRNVFKEASERELLVALREVITGEKFTDIIASEFSNIKSSEARQAYLYICFINQYRYRMPLALFIRLVGLGTEIELIREKIFKYLEGIIVFDDTKDKTDYLLGARHPVIAQVVIELFCKGDVERFDNIVNIMEHCIPSNPLEMSLIKKIYHHSTISSLFKDVNKGINCYIELTEKFPGDPFIWQQKAMLQSSFEDFEGAKESINQALSVNPNSHIFQNTQGTIYLKEALKQEDPVKAEYLRDKGNDILLKTARKYDSPFHYHSLINKLISWYIAYPSERNQKLIEEIQDILSEATKLYPSDSLIMVEFGRFQEIIPNIDSAKTYFKKAIDLNPRNVSARFLLSRILMKEDLHQAMEICYEGVLLVDDVLLNRLLLEIMHKLELKEEIISDQYHKYLNIFPNDYFIKLCKGAYLYLIENDLCTDVFADLRQSTFLSNRDKHKIEPHVNRHLNKIEIFENAFVKITTPRGYLLQTERFGTRMLIYCNQNLILKKVNIGTRIKCNIGFCYMGPVATKAEIL